MQTASQVLVTQKDGWKDDLIGGAMATAEQKSWGTTNNKLGNAVLYLC